MIKPKVLFPFVEAGFGHIMPMNCISGAFEKKYGKYCDIRRMYFYQESQNKDLLDFEQFLIKEVKKHNKMRGYGELTFIMLAIFGGHFSNRMLCDVIRKKAYNAAMKLLTEINPDLIVNTHFSTEHFSLCAKQRNLISPIIATYCPDPIIGRQWDERTDLMVMSSSYGREKAIRKNHFDKDKIKLAPFLLRKEVDDITMSKEFYRDKFSFPKNNFTILLADGAYGAGKLKKCTELLLKSKQNLTVISVCGKNQELFKYFKTLKAPSNIHFAPYGFTKEILELTRASDLFIGKAGASQLAEPTYFGNPSIITFYATPIERWIGRHYVKHLKCAITIKSPKKAVHMAEIWAQNPQLMQQYVDNTIPERRTDGGEIMADYLWEQLVKKYPELSEIDLTK